jgi:hypothetical protein
VTHELIQSHLFPIPVPRNQSNPSTLILDVGYWQYLGHFLSKPAMAFAIAKLSIIRKAPRIGVGVGIMQIGVHDVQKCQKE